MKTIAVIQPYFFPYAGYFRLFAAADVVVMFDCVQFPRRGWVHRNRFPLANGDLDWLTLPLAKAEREVLIRDLRFAPDASKRLAEAIHRFPVLERAFSAGNELAHAALEPQTNDVTLYLCSMIERVTEMLDLRRPMIRSSTLDIDPSLRAQSRVIRIVEELGGTQYVNPPGGRELYDHSAFEEAEITLRFLTPYAGSPASILSRLLDEPHPTLAAEIKAESILVA